MTIHLVLPWPRGVNVNHQYGRSDRGVHLTEQARAWREEVVLRVRTSGQALPDGLLEVQIVLWQPDRRRQDVDGCIKPILDAVLVHGFGADDARVSRLEVERYRLCYGLVRGEVLAGIEVYIKTWEHAFLETAMQTKHKAGEVERVLGREEEESK